MACVVDDNEANSQYYISNKSCKSGLTHDREMLEYIACSLHTGRCIPEAGD